MAKFVSQGNVRNRYIVEVDLILTDRVYKEWPAHRAELRTVVRAIVWISLAVVQNFPLHYFFTVADACHSEHFLTFSFEFNSLFDVHDTSARNEGVREVSGLLNFNRAELDSSIVFFLLTEQKVICLRAYSVKDLNPFALLERNVAIVKIEIAVTLVQADNIGLVESFNDTSLAILRNLSSNVLPKVEFITLSANLEFQRVFDQCTIISLASLSFDEVASKSLDLRLHQVVVAIRLAINCVFLLTLGSIFEAQKVDCLVLLAEKDDPRLFEACLLNVAQRVR